MPSSTQKMIIASGAGVAVLVVVATVAVLGLRHTGSASTADPPLAGATAPDSAAPSESPSAAPTESPSPSPSPIHSPSANRRAAPVPTKAKNPPPPPKRVVVAQPPPARSGGSPPPTSPPPGAKCPTYTGPVAPRSAVAAAISNAAGRTYRPTLSLDDTHPPAISVRQLLIQGIAWEESGWQDTIVACDGGTGTMQVMKDTADWMNLKYGTSYDFHTLDGNVSIGTGYLAWLVRYFGDKYFNGDYNLSGDPNKLVLLDLVISGYQAGYGAVDNALARADHTLPNLWYVYTVEGFMTSRPWESGG